MALRISAANPAKGKEEFNKAMTAGVMTANTDNLVFKHLADANNQNYWYGQVVGQNRKWWALTENIVTYMKPLADPRLVIYGDPATANGQYVGLKFGTSDASMLSTTEYSLLGKAVYAQNSPVQLVTYAQSLFAKAEAAKLGWITGGDGVAEQHYIQAVTNSILQWTGSSTSAASFLAKPGVKYDASTAIKQISEQRWIHLFMHGYEAWAEWRRTGYPANMVSPGGVPVPSRQAYPANEVFNNTENYKQIVQTQLNGKDDQSGKVWWDK